MLRLFLILLFLINPSLTLAFSQECKQIFDQKKVTSPVNLKLLSIQPKLSYDNSRNKASLTRMSDAHKHNHNVSVNGLTVAGFDSTIEGEFILIDLKNGYTCVLPREIKAELGYKTIKVFVASEYRPGSCEYAATIEHENEHVKINVNTFNSEIYDIQSKTTGFIQNNFPMKVPSKNSDRYALERTQQAFISYIRNMEQKRDAQHSQLDSLESYKYSLSKCNNW